MFMHSLFDSKTNFTVNSILNFIRVTTFVAQQNRMTVFSLQKTK